MDGIDMKPGVVAVVLIILGGVSFAFTDGVLRIFVGLLCIIGLLLCIRLITLTSRSERR